MASGPGEEAMGTCNDAKGGHTARIADAVGGRELAEMVAAGAELLESHSAVVNALNVFPVPDGDTGTNMSLTMRAVVSAARTQAEAAPGADAIAQAMSRSALMEARGNSGVILSQFFRGLSEGLSGRESFHSEDVARALEAAAERSYGAVGEPVEGTMLTVISAAAKRARSSADEGQQIPALLDSVCEEAERTVAATIDMLPVLAEANVVDSGGYGVQLILKGMSVRLSGGSVAGMEIPVPGGVAPGSEVALDQSFLDRAEHVGFGHCTQLLVRADIARLGEPDLDSIRERAAELATSVVVVGDADLVKIHVHTEDPESIVQFAGGIGEVIQQNIQDMDEQRTEFAAAHRAGAADRGAVSLISVALGTGFARVFAELGCTEVITGGPTMNPSVRDLTDAIDRAPTDSVIVMPNEGNVLATARQAASVSSRDVAVVPTRTVQQGVSAAMAFDPEAELAANAEAMQEAVGEVLSASITIATRRVRIEGIEVERGDFIGILEGAIRIVQYERFAAVSTLMQEAGVDSEHLVTLFRGELVSEAEAAEDLESLERLYEGTEFEMVAGGQPHYHYLISIE